MVQILQDKKKLGAVFVGLMIIGIVSLTLPTHISDADNAEFVAIGLYGGIAHPPGYPLYVLGLRLFSVFSGLFASPVTALSLFSTLCLGGGGVLFFRFLNRFGMPLWICVMASLWTFLSLPLWRMGNFVEPFGLHFLLVVAILFQIQTIVRKETPLTVMVLGLFWGFGFCNHHTLIFIAPMVLCLAFLKSRTMQAWLSLGLFFMLGFVIGLAPIVTFFTADNGLSWTWGDWSEPGARLFAHLFRTEYGTFQLVPHQSVTSLMGWQAFFKSLPDGLGFVGLAAVVLGLVLGWKELKNKAQRLWFVGHVICFAGYFVVFFGALQVGTDDPTFTVIQRFLGQAYLLLGFFLALGLTVAWNRYQKVGRQTMVPALASVALLSHIFFTFPAAQRQDEQFIQQHGENILALTQKGDVLVVNNDVETFAVSYVNDLQEQPRIVFALPMYQMPWYRNRLAEQLGIPSEAMPAKPMVLLKKIQQTRRIIIVDPQQLSREPWVAERFYPLGPVWCIDAANEAPLAPTALFFKNKSFFKRQGLLTPELTLPKTRIEKELFRKYQVPWLILCDSLKAVGAGEMHEACAVKNTFQRANSL